MAAEAHHGCNVQRKSSTASTGWARAGLYAALVVVTLIGTTRGQLPGNAPPTTASPASAAPSAPAASPPTVIGGPASQAAPPTPPAQSFAPALGVVQPPTTAPKPKYWRTFLTAAVSELPKQAGDVSLPAPFGRAHTGIAGSLRDQLQEDGFHFHLGFERALCERRLLSFPSCERRGSRRLYSGLRRGCGGRRVCFPLLSGVAARPAGGGLGPSASASRATDLKLPISS